MNEQQMREALKNFGVYFEGDKPVIPHDPKWDPNKAGMSKEAAFQAASQAASQFRLR